MERWCGEADEPVEQRESVEGAEEPTDFWDDILAGESPAIEAGDYVFSFSEVQESEPPDEPERIYRGGRCRDLPTERGRERHHLIAAQSLEAAGLDPTEGLAVQMERADHKETASYGSYPKAKAFRAEQTTLLLAGRGAEALAMGILDVQVKFGVKYVKAVEEAIDATDR